MIRMTRGNATPVVSEREPGPGWSSETVIDELVRRGFRGGGGDGAHVALERDALRVVVPGPGRELPERVRRMMESALEPHLGIGWLTAPEPAAPASPGRRVDVGERSVYVLEVVVTGDGVGEPWCACLTDDFSVLGYGGERDEALRDLKGAAACWLGVDAADVVLVTPTIV